MKTLITVVVILVLVCAAGGLAWLDTCQDLRAVQEKVSEFEGKAAGLEHTVNVLLDRLGMADDTITELRDENYRLGRINYDLREKTKLREFSSLGELKAWLAEDDTDSTLYFYGGVLSFGGIYDCDDYAVALVRNGFADGYLISWEITDDWGHMLNSTMIGNEIYFIDARTDEVWLAGYRD